MLITVKRPLKTVNRSLKTIDCIIKIANKKRPDTFHILRDYLAANLLDFVLISLTRNSPTFFPFDAPLTIAGI